MFFEQIKARDIMTPDPVCADPEDTLPEAEEKLVEHRVSGMPVVDAQGRLVGVISRADFLRVPALLDALDGFVADSEKWEGMYRPEIEEGPDGTGFHGFRNSMSRLKVKDVMPRAVVTCTPEDSVRRVAQLMVGHHVHRVIVVHGEKVVGIISSLDVARVVAQPPADQPER